MVCNNAEKKPLGLGRNPDVVTTSKHDVVTTSKNEVVTTLDYDV